MKNLNQYILKENYLKIRKEKECLIVSNQYLDIFFLNNTSAIIFILLINANSVFDAFQKYKLIYSDINEENLLSDFKMCVQDFIDNKIFIKS